MYVRKFESDTLDDALKNIKRELGPDAIILKTITNKGMKGAFSKKKIEITAAISEKDFSKKSFAEKNLSIDDKDKFYKNSSSDLSNIIEKYDKNNKRELSSSNLDNNNIKRDKEDLEKFLEYERTEEIKNYKKEELSKNESETYEKLLNHDLEEKIIVIEEKLARISQSISEIQNREPSGIILVRNQLKSLCINNNVINDIIKKIIFNLSENDLSDYNKVFDKTLEYMMERITVKMPLFSSIEFENKPSLTMLMSDNTCGQSTMLFKMISMKKDSVLIRYQHEKNKVFTEKFLEFPTYNVDKMSELISFSRKNIENGVHVFVDFRQSTIEINDTKKFIQSFRRAFGQVEVMICLSSIHSELYNIKMLNKYESIVDGCVFTHLDLCLDYGAIYNICSIFKNVKPVFFGTGEIIPDDIEPATCERIMAGIFKLDKNNNNEN